jgi:hypothetical protein
MRSQARPSLVTPDARAAMDAIVANLRRPTIGEKFFEALAERVS